VQVIDVALLRRVRMKKFACETLELFNTCALV